MKNEQLLFTYGTLQQASVQEQVIGRVIKGVADQLDNYEIGKIMINGNEYKIIHPKIGSKVIGVVISVDDNEIEAIDDYETKAYNRIRVTLDSGKIAWAYVAPN